MAAYSLPLSWVLAHHDPTYQGTGIRGFLGETWVHQVSVTLHATGALLVAGGLAAVLLLRSMTHPEGGTVWSPRSRLWVRIAILVGWGINFLGGTMRLFEPDHPSITAVGESTWVQVLLVKHLALFGAIFFSLLAIELGPRLWQNRLRLHAVIALLLVLFASISGGVSTGFMLPPMGATDQDDPLALRPTYTWHNATFPVSGATPLSPASVGLDLIVPEGTHEIHVALRWTADVSGFTAVLFDPTGNNRADSTEVDETQASLTLRGALEPGTWRIEVTSQFALQETLEVAPRIGKGIVLEETFTVTGRFFEINLYMDPDDFFVYSWHLADGDPATYWDIHSHPEGEVEMHEEGEDHHGEGMFTAGPNEVYSIMWVPDEGEEITITYRLEGIFTLHSIYR